jgi:hypothetical protein
MLRERADHVDVANLALGQSEQPGGRRRDGLLRQVAKKRPAESNCGRLVSFSRTTSGRH